MGCFAWHVLAVLAMVQGVPRWMGPLGAGDLLREGGHGGQEKQRLIMHRHGGATCMSVRRMTTRQLALESWKAWRWDFVGGSRA